MNVHLPEPPEQLFEFLERFNSRTGGPREQALAEARHYAAIYSQDGPVEIYEIHKTYTLIPA